MKISRRTMGGLIAICMAISMLAQMQMIYATDEADANVLIPEQLTIELGTQWAGAEFELETEYGLYPGVIPADDQGVLALEIGGSSFYTLRYTGTGVTIEHAASQEDQPINETSPELEPEVEPDTTEDMDIIAVLGIMIAITALIVLVLVVYYWRHYKVQSKYPK
ncbi:hypothetical protein RFF05_05215 [Bengtsoniella intestinalis]|uniref:hypothetical protein n=1 Tax=Bengtsoniella intestinalis TaxID=3073143 RepID=UPI00391F1F2A